MLDRHSSPETRKEVCCGKRSLGKDMKCRRVKKCPLRSSQTSSSGLRWAPPTRASVKLQISRQRLPRRTLKRLAANTGPSNPRIAIARQRSTAWSQPSCRKKVSNRRNAPTATPCFAEFTSISSACHQPLRRSNVFKLLISRIRMPLSVPRSINYSRHHNMANDGDAIGWTSLVTENPPDQETPRSLTRGDTVTTSLTLLMTTHPTIDSLRNRSQVT